MKKTSLRVFKILYIKNLTKIFYFQCDFFSGFPVWSSKIFLTSAPFFDAGVSLPTLSILYKDKTTKDDVVMVTNTKEIAMENLY